MPTGEYRFDGATAAKALMSLGDRLPGGKRAQGFTGDQVAELLAAIAARGKPTLEQRRERLVGSSSTAPAAQHAQLSGPGAGRGGSSA